MTKSVLAGARKDFPDRPITLSLYDPQDAPILKARYKPGEGTHYQIVPGQPQSQAPTTSSTSQNVGDPLARGGLTERDRAFAVWAESHGKSLLRYVEADLEQHGRLWFGVSREVKPEDVRPLTASLLEGAAKEFPRKALTATVFDPNGERIGKASLERDGALSWQK